MEKNQAEELYKSGSELAKAGDLQGAQEFFRKAAPLFEQQGIEKKNYKALYNAGITYYKLNEKEKSLHCLKACLHLERRFLPAHLLVAQIYQWNGNDEKTEAYLLNVIRIQPNHKAALGGLAMFYYERQKYDQSMKMLERYLLLYPDNPQLKVLQTEILARQGNYKQSSDLLQKLVREEVGFVSFNQAIQKAWEEEDANTQSTLESIQTKTQKKLKEFKTKWSLSSEDPEQFSPPEPQEALDLSLLYLFHGEPEKAVKYLVYAQKLKEQGDTPVDAT